MKTLLAIFILFLTSASIFAQTTKQSNSKESKEQKKILKQEEKLKNNLPPQTTINARAEYVRALIVSRIVTRGYEVQEATDYKIVAVKKIGGSSGILTQALLGNAYSSEPKARFAFVLAEVENKQTLLTVPEMGMYVRMAFGNENTINYNKNKKVRADIELFLFQVKQAAELREQETAKQVASETQSTIEKPASLGLSAESYNQSASTLFASKKYAEAETMYREAIKIDPYTAAYHHNLGVALSAQKKTDEAIKEMELATRLDPANEMFKKNLELIRSPKSQ